MTSLNSSPASSIREALQRERMTRRKFCLMEWRHVYPTQALTRRHRTLTTIQLLTDLHRAADGSTWEVMKKVVPLHAYLVRLSCTSPCGNMKKRPRGHTRRLSWGSFQGTRPCVTISTEHDQVGPGAGGRRASSSMANWSRRTWSR